MIAAQVNDAVIYEKELLRVVAVTSDGRRVVTRHGMYTVECNKTGDAAMQTVGKFVRRGCWPFRYWKFEPSGKKFELGELAWSAVKHKWEPVQ